MPLPFGSNCYHERKCPPFSQEEWLAAETTDHATWGSAVNCRKTGWATRKRRRNDLAKPPSPEQNAAGCRQDGPTWAQPDADPADASMLDDVDADTMLQLQEKLDLAITLALQLERVGAGPFFTKQLLMRAYMHGMGIEYEAAAALVVALVGIRGLGVVGEEAGTDPIALIEKVMEDAAGEVKLVISDETKQLEEIGVDSIAAVLAGR